jgi:hypothetical protein
MFESLFSILKASNQGATAQRHHVNGMITQKFSSPGSPVTNGVVDQQPVSSTTLILLLEVLTKLS